MYPSTFISPHRLDEYFKCELKHSIFREKMSNNSEILIIHNHNAVQENWKFKNSRREQKQRQKEQRQVETWRQRGSWLELCHVKCFAGSVWVWCWTGGGLEQVIVWREGWLVIYSVPDELSSEKANWEWALTGLPPTSSARPVVLNPFKSPCQHGHPY